MSSRMAMAMKTSTEGRVISLALKGELDVSSALTFEEALRKFEQQEPPLLVLDLRSLKFMDSTGLRVILAAHARARRQGRRIGVIEGTDAIKRIFRLTGANERLELIDRDDVASAAAASQPRGAEQGF